jgi:hypothetical protein
MTTPRHQWSPDSPPLNDVTRRVREHRRRIRQRRRLLKIEISDLALARLVESGRLTAADVQDDTRLVRAIERFLSTK